MNIESSDRRHALLRASAGTGKTYALVQRYLDALRAGVDARRIVAITFTRRAAQELRTRIRLAAAEAQLGDDVLGHIAVAPITNFHGLCLTLLEELDPGTVGEGAGHILGESHQDLALFVQATESSWFHGGPQMAQAISQAASGLRVEPALVRELWHGLAMARESARPISNDLWGRYDGARSQRQTHAALLAIRAAIVEGSALLDTPVGKAALAALLAAPLPEADAPVRAWRTAWQAVFATVSRRGKMGKLYTVEHAAFVKEAPPAVEAEYAVEALTPAMQALTMAAYNGYAQIKRVHHALDFADLIERTTALLAGHPTAAAWVRERIDVVLVDEAQDTNAIQRELVLRLAGLWAQEAGSKAAQLIIVGDWKQAIYTFRGADPDNFDRFAADVLTHGGSEETLARSYRSVPALVAGINHLGEHLFGPRYEPLEPPPEPAAGAPWGGMQWLTVTAPDGAAPSPIDEARAVARHVRARIDQGAAPSDIAVLMAHLHTAAPLYLRAFAEVGVPVVASGTGDLFSRPEVEAVVALLAWLVDPTRELDAAVALHSVLFALDDAALYALLGPEGRACAALEALRQGTLHPAVREHADADVCVVLEGAAHLLGGLAAAAEVLGPAEMLLTLDAALDVRALYEADRADAAQRGANFERLIELAHHSAAQGQATVADFVVQLRWRALRGMGEGQGQQPAMHPHAVVLSTVHASKGLQYPIVVLPGLQSRGRQGGESLLYDRTEGFVFAPTRGRERLRTRRYLEAQARAAEARAQELSRLLYVAVTRAQHEVVFVGPAPEDCRKTGFASLLGPWAARAHDVLRTTRDAPSASPPGPPGDHEAAPHPELAIAALTACDQEPAPLGPSATLRLSASALVRHVLGEPESTEAAERTTEGDVEAQRADETSTFEPPPESPPAELTAYPSHWDALEPQEEGELAHQVLASLEHAPQGSQVLPFIDAQCALAGYDPAASYLQPLRQHLAQMLSAPMGRWLRKLPITQRLAEHPFAVTTKAHGATLQLSGRFDLVVWPEDALPTLIDFKYSYAVRDDRHHTLQLRIYAWALAQLTGYQGPIRCRVVYLKAPHKDRSFVVDATSHATIAGALEGYAQTQQMPPAA